MFSRPSQNDMKQSDLGKSLDHIVEVRKKPQEEKMIKALPE
jgi:hypothetical protein